MDIKVGYYVRLKRYQGIAMIDGYDEDTNEYTLDTCIYDEYGDSTFRLDVSDIEDIQPDLKSLVHPGDLVNGSILQRIDYAYDGMGNCDKTHFEYVFDNCDKNVNEYFGDLIVDSVLTKEQIDSLTYRNV